MSNSQNAKPANANQAKTDVKNVQPAKPATAGNKPADIKTMNQTSAKPVDASKKH